MLPEALVEHLTHRITSPRSGETYVVVRPGLSLAMYYGKPLHEMVDAVERVVRTYLQFIPEGAITALCGTNAWGAFSTSRLQRQIKKLHSRSVDYTNIDLGSGPLLASEGPYGWHLNGGNLSSVDIRPNNSNVCIHEFPPEELNRVGVQQMVDWVVSIAEQHPFETGQFGYAFNQLQRTWTSQADEFVGGVAMRFLGFDILDPALAREARGLVPNCSWLNLLGDGVVERLGGEQAIRHALSSAVQVRRISGGLLLRAGELPPIGDVNRRAPDLGPVREVARLTRPLRVTKRVLFYGTEEFRNAWVHRFDE
ncbi:type VI immunity family protein [Cystobacter ferrugineus]|uniref:Uncharacterized protein n=1 Tax=Cystobacter ferrugineus TaxID=83449 RepID=A0A1L9BJC4_9BACT|nr:type VI immunity family protein [Cystobacter ferrugineus]OJH42370.1 hypothetical protein BON30_03970 [Cystobacter ferrugineus]